MTARTATVQALLRKVGSDTEAAAQLLLIAADFLESRTPMPEVLADYLATTFRRVATIPRDERAEQLSHELGLSIVGAPRKAVSAIEVASLLASAPHLSETALKHKVAKSQGIGTSTALKHIKTAKKAREVTDEMLAQTDAPLVRRMR